jgi:hypothetical protein
VVIGQVDFPGKSNDISTFPSSVPRSPIYRVVVTADSMHCQKTTPTISCCSAARINVLTVKGTQFALGNQLTALPRKDIPQGTLVPAGDIIGWKNAP